jgi:hypothetical protein
MLSSGGQKEETHHPPEAGNESTQQRIFIERELTLNFKLDMTHQIKFV